MKKNEIIFLGIIVIIVIVGLLIFWYSKTIPNDAEIEEISNPVKPADKNIFSNKISQEMNNSEIFGNSSIEVPASYNNEDPFF